MAREGLLYDLRAAVNEARKTGAAARRDSLRVKYNGRLLDVDLEVMPLISANEQRHFLVVFEDSAGETGKLDRISPVRAAKGKKAASAQEGRANQRLQRLQQELAASREYLQSIIQDLEAANEELQSANEEILSSNEELQSTNEELDTAKEELQSTNEELNTVNDELQARNEELSRANSDLLNLLSSVQIAVVMVTSDLRIRRFTPMAEKVLNLIPGDVGRPDRRYQAQHRCSRSGEADHRSGGHGQPDRAPGEGSTRHDVSGAASGRTKTSRIGSTACGAGVLVRPGDGPPTGRDRAGN